MRSLLGFLGFVAGVALGVALSFAVPSEAARNASGTYSLPSGNPVTPGTTITSSWANATLGDMASELTNSLDRQGRGAMLAPLQLASGSVGAPALTFASQTNSGLYRAGASDVRMVVGGNQVQRWDGSAAFLRGLSVSGVTAATGADRQDALTIANGDINLADVASPNKDVAISNRLTPTSIAKAWGLVTISGGDLTLESGLNLQGVAPSTNDAKDVTVTFAAEMGSANYAVVMTPGEDGAWVWSARERTAEGFDIRAKSTAGTHRDLNDATGPAIHFVVFGAQ
jgi:hypothetical protein